MFGLYFATSNDYKFAEYDRLSKLAGFAIKRWTADLPEMQEIDFRTMARQKALEAYSWLLQPVMVDVSGLRLAGLNGLPGGLNRQFWDMLHGNICEIVHLLGNPLGTMVASLAICDGQKVIFGEGEVAGSLSTHESPVGSFHLDRTFIPTGEAHPYSELDQTKRDADGPRARAVASIAAQLRGTRLGREIGIR